MAHKSIWSIYGISPKQNFVNFVGHVLESFLMNPRWQGKQKTLQNFATAKIHLGCLVDSELIFETGKSVHFLDEWHKRPTKGHSWWKEKKMALDIVTAIYHNGVRKVLEANLEFKNYELHNIHDIFDTTITNNKKICQKVIWNLLQWKILI